MESWAQEKNNTWNNYFREVTPQLAIHHIRGGKVFFGLYSLYESGQDLWANLNEEQINQLKILLTQRFGGAYF